MWFDFEFSAHLKHRNSLEGFSEDFHDVLIVDNSVLFQAGEASTSFEFTVLAGG